MTDRDAFLAAVRANPADNTVRLVFADWLDDHGEPALAEFIRVQVRLGPENRKSPRVAALAARERDLLAAHRAEWLGPLAELDADDGFGPTFARGFVEKAVVLGDKLPALADDITRFCPVLRHVELVNVRGFGGGTADAACWDSVRTLWIEDWPTTDDAAALAASPRLRNVEELSVWIGSRHDAAVLRAFATSPNLPALRRLVLVQLHGGMTCGVDAGELAERANSLAAEVNRVRGRLIATVDRPFEELLPLGPVVGRNLHAGRLPDGRQMLVLAGKTCDVFTFDAEGVLLGGDRLDLSEVLRVPPPYSFMDYNWDELAGVLNQRFGFTPGMIWVEEFDAATVIPGHYLAVYKLGGSTEFVADPDATPNWVGDDRTGVLQEIRFFLRTSNFCIAAADECWADESGMIHST